MTHLSNYNFLHWQKNDLTHFSLENCRVHPYMTHFFWFSSKIMKKSHVSKWRKIARTREKKSPFCLILPGDPHGRKFKVGVIFRVVDCKWEFEENGAIKIIWSCPCGFDSTFVCGIPMRNGIMDAFTASHVGYGTAFKGEASNLSFPKNKKSDKMSN